MGSEVGAKPGESGHAVSVGCVHPTSERVDRESEVRASDLNEVRER